ncbi:MAG TPA: 16S rRNA (cytidine(1402)-2'-O)-methyltransferase [Pyrinomonadaceae bacterium]
MATPIGNLEDITRRALRVLAEVDLIACEDTRRTGLLLRHYGIATRMLSYHEHNEQARAAELGETLRDGKSVAVVTDAGTPGISDPGFRLVGVAVECGARVVPVPGATAFVSALVASGLPTDEFFFGGFLPSRAGRRRARLSEVRRIPSTLVFYESPHRVAESLADAREILGEREAAVARELTKIHEEIIRGRLSDLARRFASEGAARGEFVLVIDRVAVGAEDDEGSAELSVAARVAALEGEGVEARAALKRVAREMGLSRPEAYRRLLSERSREGD